MFDRAPNFYEKKSMVDQLRRKWKEDKGYCSMFSKRKDFENVVCESIQRKTDFEFFFL